MPCECFEKEWNDPGYTCAVTVKTSNLAMLGFRETRKRNGRYLLTWAGSIPLALVNDVVDVLQYRHCLLLRPKHGLLYKNFCRLVRVENSFWKRYTRTTRNNVGGWKIRNENWRLEVIYCRQKVVCGKAQPPKPDRLLTHIKIKQGFLVRALSWTHLLNTGTVLFSEKQILFLGGPLIILFKEGVLYLLKLRRASIQRENSINKPCCRLSSQIYSMFAASCFVETLFLEASRPCLLRIPYKRSLTRRSTWAEKPFVFSVFVFDVSELGNEELPVLLGSTYL